MRLLDVCEELLRRTAILRRVHKIKGVKHVPLFLRPETMSSWSKVANVCSHESLSQRSIPRCEAVRRGLYRYSVTLPLVKYQTPFSGYESISISICVDAQCVSLLVNYVLFQTDILRLPHCQIAEWIFKFDFT